MLDDIDGLNQLERELRKTLYGDDKLPGLYRAILHSQNWEQFVTTRAQIVAHEATLGEIRKIVRRINGEPAEPEVAERRVN